MYIIENPKQFRENVCKRLEIILNNKKISENLEKGIYNFCIKKSDEKYIDRLRTVFINIQNVDLKKNILEKKIKAHEIAFMTHQEMSPEKWQKKIDDKKIKDENRYAPKIEASTDNFTCRKCKSNKCTYYQLQTRSADEPMTTFVTCIECGTRWKC
jgi:transcription elongation factor S-II